MSMKHKKVCRVLNYMEHSLIVISIITRCISISAFASLVGICLGIASSAIRLQFCVITARIKNQVNKQNKSKRNMIK